ncbi:WD40 repeat domain-containing protein [Flindersiella endophytica]
MSLDDCAFLVHADPRQVIPLLPQATGAAAQLAAAVYRTSLHEHRDASPFVRRQLLSLDAARWGSRELAERFAAVPVAGGAAPQWQVTSAGGTGVNAAFLFSFDGPEQARTAAVTELDGRPIAVVGGFDGLRAWDLATGEPIGALAELKHVVTVTETDGRVLALAEVFEAGGEDDYPENFYDEDDEDAGYGSEDGERRLQVWDLAAGRPICEPFDGPHEYLAEVAFTVCDGVPVVVTFTRGEPVAVWPGGSALLDPEDDNVAVACATVAGSPVIVTAKVQTVQVWSRPGDAWTCSLTFDSPDWLSSVAISELDARPVIVTGSDDQLRVWDLLTGEPVRAPLPTGHGTYVDELRTVVLPDRTLAVTGSHTDSVAHAWDLATGARLGRPLSGHRGRVSAVAIGVTERVGHRLFAVTADNRDQVRLWDLSAEHPSGGLPSDGATPAEAWATTELSGRPVTLTGSWDDGLQVRDRSTGEPIGRPFAAGESLVINATACSMVEGRPIALIAGSGEAAAVRRWDLLTGEPMSPLLTRDQPADPWDSEAMLALACTELRGRPVAVAGGESAELWLWDLTTGEPIGKPMTGHLKWSWEAVGKPGLGTKLSISAVACARLPDRPIAVTGGEDGTVRRWDLASGQQLGNPQVAAPLSDDKSETITTVACGNLHDRPIAASGSQNHTVRLWDLTTGAQLGPPLPFPDAITRVELTFSGELVVEFGTDVAVLTQPQATNGK